MLPPDYLSPLFLSRSVSTKLMPSRKRAQPRLPGSTTAAAIPELETEMVGAGRARRARRGAIWEMLPNSEGRVGPPGRFSPISEHKVGGGMYRGCRDEKLAQLKPHVGPTCSPLDLGSVSPSTRTVVV